MMEIYKKILFFAFITFLFSSCALKGYEAKNEIGHDATSSELRHILNLHQQNYRRVHVELSEEQIKKVEELVEESVTVRAFDYYVLKKKNARGMSGRYFSVKEGDKEALVVLQHGEIKKIKLHENNRHILLQEERFRHILRHSFHDLRSDLKKEHYINAPQKLKKLLRKVFVSMAILKVINESDN